MIAEALPPPRATGLEGPAERRGLPSAPIFAYWISIPRRRGLTVLESSWRDLTLSLREGYPQAL